MKPTNLHAMKNGVREAWRPVMYRTAASEAYSFKKNRKKPSIALLQEKFDDDVEYSSTDSEDDLDRFKKYDDFAWDEDMLKKIQMDEYTRAREFRKLTVQATNNLQDQKFT